MEIQTIQMDPEQAREQLHEYRRALHRRADAEYEAVVAGLEALADGTPILSLTRSIEAAGFDARGRPRLAIARADRQQVRFSWSRPYRAFVNGVALPAGAYFDTSANWGPIGRDTVIGVPIQRPSGASAEGYALVPLIPAAVRNAVRFRADRTFVLWEVEQWSDRPLGARPDRDPYLLRHLHGDAYAVLASWDLTPLEQLVMAGRAHH